MLTLLRRGQLSKWFSGIGQEAISVGLVAALEPDDWILPVHRNLAVFTGRGLDLGVLFRQLLGREGGFTGGRDRTLPLRLARPPRRGHDQPPGRHGPGGRRAGARGPAARRGPGGGGARGRRGHQRGRRARGHEPGRGVEAARALRHREQPLGPVHARLRAVRVRPPGRPRRGLRHGRRDRRRQRRRGRARGGGPGRGAGPGGRRSHPAGVQDVPHAGPRGGVGHRLRAGGAAGGLGGARDPIARVRGPARRRGPPAPPPSARRWPPRCGPTSTPRWPTP